jgi:serine/threonine-protein kinase
MGDVYRAEDTRLKRDVAIKVLPAELAADKERLARMEREAQVLAALNHTNIAAIYGLEEAAGVRFLVMELAEGATLADRIASGPIPLEEALPIGLAITEALEAAHASGIVHRDLKPANVQIGADGKVTLLDFGLAKVYENAGNSDSSLTMAESPTYVQATQAGVILGTAPYMSPEQARGHAVDARSDIWAFGCVMYEMLSGAGAFAGPTVTDVLGSIVHKDPDWDALPRRTPLRIRMVMLRCLRKDPVRRLQAIGDARIAIQEYIEDPRPVEEILEAPPSAPMWQRFLPWGVAAAAAVVAIWTAIGGQPVSVAEPPLAVRIALDAEGLFDGLGSSLVLTPDGDRLIYSVSTGDGVQSLRVRSLSTGATNELYSGPSAYHPFLSPDGAWVGFSSGEELQKIPLSGGSPISIVAVERNRGASWSADNNIVYAPSPTSPLSVVSANGGESRVLTTLDDGELTHRWPQVLPNGKILFTAHTASTDFDSARVEIFDPVSGERRVVVRGGYYGRYLPGDFVTYVSDGSLFGARLDPDRGELIGSPVPMITDLASNNNDGGAQIDVGASGRAVYHTGGVTEPVFPALWVDTHGRSSPLWSESRTYAEPRVSPDGSKVSFMALADNNWDVWVYDLRRDVATRMTFDAALDGPGVWSPDGKWIAFSSARGAQGYNIYRRLADGSGEAERLTDFVGDQFLSDWSVKGHLLFAQGSDLWSHDLNAGTSQPYLESNFTTQEGAFAPSGDWIAYASDESGRYEIYVRPFPGGGGKWQVSSGGGNYPRWSGDGTKIFYRTAEGLMVADVEANADGFRAGRPQELFSAAFRGGAGGMVVGGLTLADWAAHPSGEQFVMFPVSEEGELGVALVTLETNWLAKLDRTLGGNR